ncbi:MAG TPA: inositol monophosphatase family protein [Tepidisphaeraceae bacterium]
MGDAPSLSEFLDVATAVARAGGEHTLQYFNRGAAVELKEDQSPVTRADREAELLIRELILQKYPTHSILGEEHGSVDGDADYQWVIDPIDGTKSFIHGVPLYTTLIGLQIKSRPSVGVIFAPALNEMVSAAIDETGAGSCYLNGQVCGVSTVSEMSKALFLTSGTSDTDRRLRVLYDLASRCKYGRTWGDGYGYLMVATGRAEIMIDPKMNPWDVAALIPVIKAAGGICESWRGEETIHGGDLFACNAALAEQVREALREA